MLPLDSPRWNSLSHAYGPATDVPKMLREVEHAPEIWSDIWSALCHQGTVYTASYAAVPHIVELAACLGPASPVCLECLYLVGAIAKSRYAAAIPDDLAADYAAALRRAEPLVRAALEDRSARESAVVYLLQCLCALRGCVRTADVIEGLVDGEHIVRCPGETCGVEIYVTIEDTRMVATIEDPATEDVEDSTEVAPPATPPDPRTAAWTDEAVLPLLVELATRAGHSALAAKLALWGGTVTCPKCRETFGLGAALRDPSEL